MQPKETETWFPCEGDNWIFRSRAGRWPLASGVRQGIGGPNLRLHFCGQCSGVLPPLQNSRIDTADMASHAPRAQHIAKLQRDPLRGTVTETRMQTIGQTSDTPDGLRHPSPRNRDEGLWSYSTARWSPHHEPVATPTHGPQGKHAVCQYVDTPPTAKTPSSGTGNARGIPPGLTGPEPQVLSARVLTRGRAWGTKPSQHDTSVNKACLDVVVGGQGEGTDGFATFKAAHSHPQPIYAGKKPMTQESSGKRPKAQ